MSSQFYNPYQQDLAATFLLGFVTTSRIIQVDLNESLVLFLLATSFFAFTFHILWNLIMEIEKYVVDRKRTHLGSYYYAWNHVYFRNYKNNLIANIRYILAGIILLVPGNTPFFELWFNLNNLRELIGALLVVIPLLLILSKNRNWKTNLKLVRITIIETNQGYLAEYMKNDDWGQVHKNREKLIQRYISTITSHYKYIDEIVQTLQKNHNVGRTKITGRDNHIGIYKELNVSLNKSYLAYNALLFGASTPDDRSNQVHNSLLTDFYRINYQVLFSNLDNQYRDLAIYREDYKDDERNSIFVRLHKLTKKIGRYSLPSSVMDFEDLELLIEDIDNIMKEITKLYNWIRSLVNLPFKNNPLENGD